GLACGAEDILIPEVSTDISEVLDRIARDERRKKTVHVLVVSEHDDFGGADKLGAVVRERFPALDVRSTILGHIQRGGAPTCADRILSSRLGFAAVQALREGKTQVMAGIVNGQVVFTPFEQAVKGNVCISKDLL